MFSNVSIHAFRDSIKYLKMKENNKQNFMLNSGECKTIFFGVRHFFQGILLFKDEYLNRSLWYLTNIYRLFCITTI
jgi:hypothetical protein